MDRFQIPGAPTCVVCFPKGLFEKTVVKGAENADPKYNAIILIPKSDTEKVARVQAEFDKAFKELQAAGYKGKTVASINPKNNCWEDGDLFADSKDNCEQFRGYWRLKVASKNNRPIVTDLKRRTILNGIMLPGLTVDQISDEQLADGDFVFVNVSFWVYNKSTFSGIGANVHAIMRAKEGTPLCGAPTDVDSYIDTEGYE